jgi:ribonucleoside-diphosphate reductase alpha chain
MPLTRNAIEVLRARYLLRDSAGSISETPEQLFHRVANAIAQPESPKNRKRWAAKFYEMMSSLRFMPNSPTLMNAGKKKGQLAACFVLPIEDSLDKIFDTLKSAALIQQSGGGTGFAFSRIRPKGSIVKSSHGIASGPVGFIKIFDTATETVKQGGTRRGANMAVLSVDHPDILEFIRAKRDQSQILNFNVSVGITAGFMRALETGASFALKDPRTRKPIAAVSAQEVFDEMIAAAWECGDPGVVFLDRIGFFNPTPKLGDMESTNPCGEQPLLPFESCNLGSLNLGAYYKEGAFDWNLFREDIHAAVRFLDNVIDVNTFPIPETGKITRKNRKIGLGVMGFADLLLKQGIPYDSGEAILVGEKVMAFLNREAKKESAALAKARGAFPAYKGSMWEHLGYPKLRNATVTTVAPTGTISMIAGCSSGIEPIFAGVFYRNVLDGGRLLDVHPAVAELLPELNGERAPSAPIGLIDDKWIATKLGKAWRPAGAISVEAHVRMQSVFQRHSDSAVSKTINLPQDATPQQVAQAYRLAYDLGCKGITIYRDQGRGKQVLEKPKGGVERSDAGEIPDGESCPSC